MTPRTQNLGQKTARGMAMLTAQTLLGKVISSLGQLVLAWILVPEAFGLVALAYTVMSFSRIIEQIGLREILIRAQDRFERWENSAMWLAGLLGLGVGVVTLATAPLAATLFEAPGITGLIWVLAAATPFWSLSQICEAKLERDLRFARVTTIQFGAQTGQVVLSVVFALIGFGAYSFVAPRLVVGIVKLVYVWRMVRPRVRKSPQLHRWGALVRQGLPITGAVLFQTITANADYFVLGLIATKAVVGFYFFAFNQSTQIVQIFASNLMRVMVPSLSTLKDDPKRQVDAFLRGTRLLACAAAPLCVMQAACAGPTLRLLYGERWVEAIPLLQILSSAAVFGFISWPTISLLMAQGRYTTRMVLTGCAAGVFTLVVTIGALVGREFEAPALGAAIAVACYRVVMSPMQAYVACRSAGVRWATILHVFFMAALGAGLTIGPAWWLGTTLPGLVLHDAGGHGIVHELMHVAIVLTLGPSLYVAWLRLSQRELWRELVSRGLGVLPGGVARRVPAWVR
ncbi:MAG: lipopolysaccharide biosynthesis protein [Phycisphaerales bacterium]|jgi:PST family polysaccharide transporter|nr:lipopolysaccharide biosynthesis protein [Phycisphaerales bacterium]